MPDRWMDGKNKKDCSCVSVGNALIQDRRECVCVTDAAAVLIEAQGAVPAVQMDPDYGPLTESG